jgi:glutamate/tyrosine decarboxylase-like PLP-dependent enzyme
VKNPRHLTDTYSSHPDYYNFSGNDEDQAQNYYEYGLQNSRGFRALKVWITLQQVGKNGYARMIAEDIELAGLLFENAKNHSDLEAITHSLSITTFRYVPTDYNRERKNRTAYLNTLNEKLLNVLQEGGELFLSNAIVNEMYCLRACIVNFRTSKKDIEEIIEIVVREGAKVHEKLQEKLEQDRI